MKRSKTNTYSKKGKSRILKAFLFISILLFIFCVKWLADCLNQAEKLPMYIPITNYNENTYSSADTITNYTVYENDEWKLILVNKANPIPDDFEINLTEIENGYRIDTRFYDAYEDMFLAAESNGIELKVNSAYRTFDEQQQTMDEKVDEYMAQGYSHNKSQELAKQLVADPGTSEHETGLAIDIISEDGDSWTAYSWLAENAYKYGFILRYPEEKESITGINYEPWHYRYVGTEAALDIYTQGLCLEEYLILISN